ncbi:MAG: hypothetical protein QOJ12_471, partial [Thermoleophilales bacterium]|nr:hypothetical protein [Thermoleophilales bacterium]
MILAHGIVQRADVPIPEVVFFYGAAGILVVSFVLLALFWPQPKLEGAAPAVTAGAQARLWSAVDVVCGAVGVFLFGVVVWAGLAGVQTVAANITPTLVYVVFWTGLVLLSVLFGDVFRAFNPWRAIARAVGGVAQLASGNSMPKPLPYPERLGRWPAVVGLFLFALLELVVQDGNLPRTV